MQSDDARGKIVIATALKSGGLHHALERFLIRMHANRLSQVLVALGVISDQSSQRRQDLE